MTEDIFLKHGQLIEEYCQRTTKEWRWFAQEQPELDRRKTLLLQSIKEELSRSADLLRDGREGEEAKSAEWPQFVHVLSPSLRSGTNLLASLLVESGSCQWPRSDRIEAEDFFLKNAD